MSPAYCNYIIISLRDYLCTQVFEYLRYVTVLFAAHATIIKNNLLTEFICTPTRENNNTMPTPGIHVRIIADRMRSAKTR